MMNAPPSSGIAMAVAYPLIYPAFEVASWDAENALKLIEALKEAVGE